MAETSVMQAIEDAKRAIAAAPAEPAAAEPDNTEPGTPTEPTPAEDKEPEAEETPEDEPTIGDIAKRCDSLEARVTALEEAAVKATDESAALTKTLQEATGTITRLVAILRDPARAQAYSRGEDTPARPKADPNPGENALTRYLALPSGSKAALDFYRAHADEIAALANSKC